MSLLCRQLWVLVEQCYHCVNWKTKPMPQSHSAGELGSNRSSVSWHSGNLLGWRMSWHCPQLFIPPLHWGMFTNSVCRLRIKHGLGTERHQESFQQLCVWRRNRKLERLQVQCQATWLCGKLRRPTASQVRGQSLAALMAIWRSTRGENLAQNHQSPPHPPDRCQETATGLAG